MSLIVVGTNHRYSPIEIRERISFSKKRISGALLFLKENFAVARSVILSTCNRVEIYADVEYLEAGFKRIEEFLSRYHEIAPARIAPYLYRYDGRAAAGHLAAVASGLDSQVLGETEILGQVKYFYNEARLGGFTEGLMDNVFAAAIDIAKAVRGKTAISRGNVSIAGAAIALIKEDLGPIGGRKVLVIGLGEISRSLIDCLAKEEARTIFISNRTHEKAKSLAKVIGGRAVRFKRLKEELKNADIVISATASPHVILGKTDFEDAGCGESAAARKVLVIDLALPRDIDPEAGKISGVKLFNLDDLKCIVEENVGKREEAARAARACIDEELDGAWRRLTGLERERALWR